MRRWTARRVDLSPKREGSRHCAEELRGRLGPRGAGDDVDAEGRRGGEEEARHTVLNEGDDIERLEGGDEGLGLGLGEDATPRDVVARRGIGGGGARVSEGGAVR